MKKGLVILLALFAVFTILNAVPRNLVLVEGATSTRCPYCPYAVTGFDALMAGQYPVAIIEYHDNGLGPDPYTNTDSSGRCTYYGASSYPDVFFDGGNEMEGVYTSVPMINYYGPAVNNRITVPAHFTISATGTAVGNTYTANVVLDKVDPDTNTNLRLHAVVTESNISYNWQGLNHLDDVARMMVPNYNGTTITFGTGTQLTIPLTFTMNPAWVANNCELVLFLQNHSTKEVLQCVKYSFPELYGAYAPSVSNIDFPDTYITGESVQPLTIHNYWSTVATGTITSDNPAVIIEPVARLNFTIQPHQSVQYNVKFIPTTTGDLTANINITSNMPDNENITIPVTGYGFLNAAPVVSDIVISGIPVVTMLQTATYSYTDADSDMEGLSSYQWYRITPPSTTPVAISGATSMTYRLVTDDIGSYVVFQIIPRDSHTMPGQAVMSIPASLVEVLPAPQNLTYQVVDGHDIVLSWERPNHFSRDLLGYRVFRGGLAISVINNPATTTFTDTWLNPGEYQYWVTSVFTNPVSQSGPSNVVTVNLTSTQDNVAPVIEAVQVYPNPFSQTATIYVNSKANSAVELNVFNVKGQLVLSRNTQTNSQGSLNFTLERNELLTPGLYFIKVNTAVQTHTSKVLLLNR